MSNGPGGSGRGRSSPSFWQDARVQAPLPRRVLIVRLGAIGDVVNALVLATALKRHAPSIEIGWAVHPLARPLVEGHPAIDRVHVWERGRGIAGAREIVGALRRERYDLAVDLQRITKSALLARLSGAPRVLGYDRRRAKELSWLWTKERIGPGPAHAHMVEQYLEFARHLGVPEPVAELALPPDAEADSWAQERLAELGGPPVLLGVGASKPANRWPPERFGRLAVDLERELGHPVCLVGGPGDGPAAERALAAAGPDSSRIRNLVGGTTLRQLTALLGHAALFVGCDTGPMHLAVASGAPTLALFGPADPRRTGPWGERHRVVRTAPPCAPCNRKHCNQPRHACMEDIAPRDVLAATRTLLGRNAAGGSSGTDS